MKSTFSNLKLAANIPLIADYFLDNYSARGSKGQVNNPFLGYGAVHPGLQELVPIILFHLS